ERCGIAGRRRGAPMPAWSPGRRQLLPWRMEAEDHKGMMAVDIFAHFGLPVALEPLYPTVLVAVHGAVKAVEERFPFLYHIIAFGNHRPIGRQTGRGTLLVPARDGRDHLHRVVHSTRGILAGYDGVT